MHYVLNFHSNPLTTYGLMAQNIGGCIFLGQSVVKDKKHKINTI